MSTATIPSATTLLMILLGAVVGGGVVLLVRALTPQPPRVDTGPGVDLRRISARIGIRGALAGGAALFTLLATRWVVAAVAAALLALAWPALFGGARAEKQAMARLEGLASWTESLRDTIAGSVGLEQAIPATAYAAAPAIAEPLRTLADRLRVRTPMPTALGRFADDMDDASADLIIAALILNSRLRGPGLRQVLTSLAESARTDLDMRRRISAGRASTRRSVQIVCGITVLFMIGLPLLNPTYVEPFSDLVGQVVLAVVCVLFGLGFAWMRRLAVTDSPQRFLRPVPVAASVAGSTGRPVGGRR